ncbi:hypothetical protein LCGC14_3105710, partial [marine sediment metagenome]
MKKNIIYYILSIVFTVSLLGCEEYLEIPVEAGLAEEDIFSNYKGFQGFQDQVVTMIRDYTRA